MTSDMLLLLVLRSVGRDRGGVGEVGEGEEDGWGGRNKRKRKSDWVCMCVL